MALIHKSLPVMSLRPKSNALSLMDRTTGLGTEGVGSGTVGFEDKLPRMPRTELLLGWVRRTKGRSGDLVVDVLKMSSGT